MQIEVSFATPLVVVHKHKEGWSAVFTFQFGDFIFRGENMDGTMQVGTYATLSVQWNDSKGNPAKVDGPTKWESTAPDTVQVTVSTGNPLISNLFAPGPVGTADIHATADADMGEGTKSVTATCKITVISGEAVAGDIKFSQNTGQGGPPPSGQAKGATGSTPPASAPPIVPPVKK
jgi:hypothetical protein